MPSTPENPFPQRQPGYPLPQRQLFATDLFSSLIGLVFNMFTGQNPTEQPQFGPPPPVTSANTQQGNTGQNNAAQTELSAANRMFVGRREVMFNALRQYHQDSHAGLTDAQRIDALTDAVNQAAARNARLSERERAVVALEWDRVLHSRPAAEILAFTDDQNVIALAGQPMPQIPQSMLDNISSRGIDLRRQNVNDQVALLQLMVTSTPEQQATLRSVAGMSDRFERAAGAAHTIDGQRHSPLIDYTSGASVTSTLDATDALITPVQVAQRQADLVRLGSQRSEGPSHHSLPGLAQRGAGLGFGAR